MGLLPLLKVCCAVNVFIWSFCAIWTVLIVDAPCVPDVVIPVGVIRDVFVPFVTFTALIDGTPCATG